MFCCVFVCVCVYICMLCCVFLSVCLCACGCRLNHVCVCMCMHVSVLVCVCVCQTVDRRVGSRLEGTRGPSQGFKRAPLLVTVVSGRLDSQVLYHSPRYPPNSTGPQCGWKAGLCARGYVSHGSERGDST